MSTPPDEMQTAAAPRGKVRLTGRLDAPAPVDTSQAVAEQRRLLADFCRLLGGQPVGSSGTTGPAGAANQITKPDPLLEGLPPRIRETLDRILAGDSEKQVASRLGISPHTVHVYMKALHRRFNVSSRGELLARFVHPPTGQ